MQDRAIEEVALMTGHATYSLVNSAPQPYYVIQAAAEGIVADMAEAESPEVPVEAQDMPEIPLAPPSDRDADDESEDWEPPEEENVGQWSPPRLDPRAATGQDIIPEEEDARLLELLRAQVWALS